MLDGINRTLTAREVDCLRGVAEHKRTKVIAAELKLAPKTVDTYIASAARKLGVSDRDSAVRAWLRSEENGSGLSPWGKTEVGDEHNIPSEEPAGTPWWPFQTRENPKNDLSIGQRLAWIVVLGALMLAAGAFYMLGMRMLVGHL